MEAWWDGFMMAVLVVFVWTVSRQMYKSGWRSIFGGRRSNLAICVVSTAGLVFVIVGLLIADSLSLGSWILITLFAANAIISWTIYLMRQYYDSHWAEMTVE